VTGQPAGLVVAQSADAPERAGTRVFWIPLWLGALFVAALALNTRHNDFPYFYHPDEGEKVRQIITGEWNYHHPMLLLTATKLFVQAAQVPAQEQPVVESGREVSAFFAAVAISALSMLALAWRGWPAAIATGMALLFHHHVFELAHYFKEDTALLCGLALTFLVAWGHGRKPGHVSAALLGLSAAVAISGKYLGVCALAVALPVLWSAPGGKRRAELAWFAGALLLALFVINLPLVLNPSAFARSFDREMDLAVNGQRGTTRDVPHTLYWNIFRDNTTAVMWALLLVFLAARWRERRRLTVVEWLLIAFPFAFTLALSFSPKSNDRYFLPATGLFTLFAALGVSDAARLLMDWVPQRWSAGVLTVALVAAQLPSWLRYDVAFQYDDNRELFAWVQTQLPPEAVIAKDGRVQLPETGNARDEQRLGTLPQKILGGKFAADLGTIEELRQHGVTHVAVSESDYGRFRLDGVRPKKGEEQDFTRRKAFYDELLRDGGEPLFRRERSTVLYLHPGVRLYELPAGE
jgi:hypothetical protein